MVPWHVRKMLLVANPKEHTVLSVTDLTSLFSAIKSGKLFTAFVAFF